MPPLRIAVLVKGYPRLSETFIAQEILALEARGLALAIWSLRRPTEKTVHPMHRRIRARVAGAAPPIPALEPVLGTAAFP